MSQFMNSNNIPSFKLVSYKEKPDTYRAKPYKTKQQKNTQSEDNTDIELFNIGYKYGHCDTPNENGIGLYYERSMVFMVSPESPDGKLIAYSPSKTHKNDTFRESVEYNSQTNSGYIDNIVIEELVEGTMVYLFYIPNVGWEMSTRSNIGAGNKFFTNDSSSRFENTENIDNSRSYTFREMFMDAWCNQNTFDTFDELQRGYTYVFMLQHPQNRIVAEVTTPSIVLIAVYQIIESGSDARYIDIYNDDANGHFQCFRRVVRYTIPEQYSDSDNNSRPDAVSVEPNTMSRIFQNLNTRIHAMNEANNGNDTCGEHIVNNQQPGYEFMGFVIKDTTNGSHTTIRNPQYDYVRDLRGNQPKLEFKYLQLEKQKRVLEYLSFFPEHTREFHEFSNKKTVFTSYLYEYYVNCFIHKMKPLASYSFQYRKHMKHIHQYFMDHLRPNKMCIRRHIVESYVNRLPEAMLLFALNYDNRNHENRNHVNRENNESPTTITQEMHEPEQGEISENA